MVFLRVRKEFVNDNETGGTGPDNCNRMGGCMGGSLAETKCRSNCTAARRPIIASASVVW